MHLLAELYGRVNGGKEGSKFELVFVSSDRCFLRVMLVRAGNGIKMVH